MIGYTSIGTNDLKKSGIFYDELLKMLGAYRMMEFEDFIVWSKNQTSPAFSVHIPIDGNPASVGNGVMIALAANDTKDVDSIHAKAIQLGAEDEGKPGPRGDSGFYAGYFRDPDGNKLNIHCMG